MRRQFPLFQSHLDLAHRYWTGLLLPSDHAIDATCGNGHDALILAKLVPQGTLKLLDIQKKALDTTYSYLEEALPKEALARVSFHNICHSKIDEVAPASSIKLIVYNLGYLPGADKTLTTKTETTIQSIEKSLALLCSGGVVSITCYPGHPEGEKELAAICEYTKKLESKEWSVSLQSWLNRTKHPCLLIIQKPLNTKNGLQSA